MRLRGGVEQARANMIALRGAVMEPAVENQDTSQVDVRGAIMVAASAEAQLTIVTERKP